MIRQVRLLTICSIIFAFAVFISSIAGCSLAKSESKITPVKSEVKKGSKVIVYYFHGNKRCPSCRKIEAYTKEAVQSINNNRLELHIVNIDETDNKHFVKDYGLFTKSVVISSVKNAKQEKWKNLDKIWTLLGNEAAFENYIKKEVKSYL
ncbi:MAG: hypothetical protein ACD_20C00086G0014 [uncultured bacterium]|nr:MAG: hypothetical protein ACD_20C00086G0014 [uncultured bacterium]HBH17636.1 hypothetical protein [Cyanobacteria bacterium UBA9579]